MGAPGRYGARRRVGAADSDKVRVCAAEAKGYDRHCGSQRSAQLATLPGLHREAGVPERAHSDLVRDAQTLTAASNINSNPVHVFVHAFFFLI